MRKVSVPFSDRKCYRVATNLYRMDQVIQVHGEHDGYDATGPYWVVGIVKVKRGKIWFLRDGLKVEPDADLFVVAMPKGSVAAPILKNAFTINSAIYSKTKEPKLLPREPTIFSINVAPALRGLSEVDQVLEMAYDMKPIQRVSGPNAKSQRLMKYLGQNFDGDESLSELSRRFGLSPSVMSRTFRRDWGKPPIHFRNYLRVFDAFRFLVEDRPVTDVALEVGFNDLSRFMKQFKGTTGYTPRGIQKRSKNAK